MIEYHVGGEKLEIVRIPPGYAHNIINDGDADLVTVMWANEVFSPSKPDTFAEKVRQGDVIPHTAVGERMDGIPLSRLTGAPNSD